MEHELLVERHIKYFKLCLNILPSRLQKEDSNKLLLLYCAIGGLSLLRYQFTEKERKDYAEYIYGHLVQSGEGFRGSLVHSLPGINKYDPATLPSTYSALCCLLMIGEDFSKRVDREKIMAYVSQCQVDNGSFLSYVDIYGKPFGDGDLRQCYLAVSIRKMLGYGNDAEQERNINVRKLVEYIKSQKQHEGGLGSGESHAGLTFCGLAALEILGVINADDAEWKNTTDWLIHRQIDFSEYNQELLQYHFCDEIDIGSYNGRPNKFGDTCYSFWCAAGLDILKKSIFVNGEKAEIFLLNITQNKILGGFSKSDADDPDPYHSFLALAALSLFANPSIASKLRKIECSLCVDQDSFERISYMYNGN